MSGAVSLNVSRNLIGRDDCQFDYEAAPLLVLRLNFDIATDALAYLFGHVESNTLALRIESTLEFSLRDPAQIEDIVYLILMNSNPSVNHIDLNLFWLRIALLHQSCNYLDLTFLLEL